MPEINFSRRGALRDAILAYIAKHPGVTCEQIATALVHDVSSVRATMTKLTERGGVVARYRKGRDFVYTLVQQISPIKEPEAYSADVEALRAQLEELEAFKAKALAVHPDLAERDYEPYRPVLIEFYRAIGNDVGREFAEVGYTLDEDDTTTIEALIAASKAIAEIEVDDADAS